MANNNSTYENEELLNKLILNKLTELFLNFANIIGELKENPNTKKSNFRDSL